MSNHNRKIDVIVLLTVGGYTERVISDDYFYKDKPNKTELIFEENQSGGNWVKCLCNGAEVSRYNVLSITKIEWKDPEEKWYPKNTNISINIPPPPPDDTDAIGDKGF